MGHEGNRGAGLAWTCQAVVPLGESGEPIVVNMSTVRRIASQKYIGLGCPRVQEVGITHEGQPPAVLKLNSDSVLGR